VRTRRAHARPKIGIALAGGGLHARPEAAREVEGQRTVRSPREPALPKPRARARPKIGIALAGGGPLGGIYEIGALAALADALDGVDFNALDVYVGVSSGGFIAAGLANGISPREMSRMFIESESHAEPFDPALVLRPAFREYLRRAASLPPLVSAGLWRILTTGDRPALLEAFAQLGQALPTGIFDNRAIEAFLARVFTAPGRANDFRRLKRKLFLVATDLDTGASVKFGAPGHDHVPISTAVQASAALPGLFPPVEIDGHHFVDGALKRTLHASVALEQGVKLLFCINPLVPFDTRVPTPAGDAPRRIVEGGLPAVLAQTLRTIVHSRMQVGMRRYEREFPDADVVLFEPHRHDAEMFLTNFFSFASRRRLAEHAYQRTLAELLARREELARIFARHGIEIRLGVVIDRERRLVQAGRRRRPFSAGAAAVDRLSETLGVLEHWLARHHPNAR
jgi:predicted acylesterase/phospholipase RssA